jgi:arylsulfatase A-like enzyme
MKRLFRLGFFGFGLGALALQGSEGSPNILLINADDLGWRDVGFMGGDFYETPHLDALAVEGMVFEQAYAGAANCAPSRAVLLRGQYSPRHEVYNVGTGTRGDVRRQRVLHVEGRDTLDPAVPTWVRLFADAGWQLGQFGKWHMGTDPAAGPLAHGFAVNVGGDHSGSPPNYFAPFKKGVPGLGGEAEGSHVTAVIAEAAAGFIRKNRERSWLAYVPFFDVHTPIRAREDLVAYYEKKQPGALHDHVVYAAMVHAMDEAVGRLLKVLEETGQAERTVVVFTSDNGGYGPVTRMDPLRGYKGTYYEGGIRVPLLVRWPGVVKAGQRCLVPVHQVDLHPTLCEIAGVRKPEGLVLDGRSLVKLLRDGVDETLVERSLFWHFPAYLQSYARTNSQRDAFFRSRPVTVMRKGDWKLMLYHEEWVLDGGREKLPGNAAVELYHLGRDVGEAEDLAAVEVERREALLTELLAWLAETGAPLAEVENPEFGVGKNDEL